MDHPTAYVKFNPISVGGEFNSLTPILDFFIANIGIKGQNVSLMSAG